MDHIKITLNAEKRTIAGKQVKKLRKEGITPANVYGKDMDSQSIQVNAHDFLKTFRSSGETQVIYLVIGKDEMPVMVHHVQFHPISEEPLHVDFKKVDLKKKIEAHVPIKLVNESPAVNQHLGDLLTLGDSIMVEALPNEIPHEIEIDISILTEVNSEIKVGDIKAGVNFAITDDPERTLVRIAEHKEEDLTPDTETEIAEGTEEKSAESEDGATEEGSDGGSDSDDKKE